MNMGELSYYDQANMDIVRCDIFRDNMVTYKLESMLFGILATSMSCPADMVKTRMMNQSGKEYTGSLDFVVKTMRKEGMITLWKGFFSTWSRLGPWKFVLWVSYEKLWSIGLSLF